MKQTALKTYKPDLLRYLGRQSIGGERGTVSAVRFSEAVNGADIQQ